MIKQKLLNIFLIVVLLIIWSIAGYRLFSQPEEAEIPEFQIKPVNEVGEVKPFTKKRDLIISGKNPFNSKQTKAKNIKPVFKKTKELKENVEVKDEKSNIISYHGSIKGNDNNVVHIIKINRQIKRFKKGQKIGDVTLLKVIENGVLVLDRKEKREIFER